MPQLTFSDRILGMINFNKPVKLQAVFHYLTKKWWLPIMLVGAALVYAIIGSWFWHQLFGTSNSFGFALIGLSGFPFMGSILLILSVIMHQIYNRNYLLGVFNIIMVLFVYIVIWFFSISIT